MDGQGSSDALFYLIHAYTERNDERRRQIDLE